VQWFSLQKGERAVEAGAWGAGMIDLMGACADFLDTAALISALDLVITVDSAVAHLAGALGRDVWMLDRFGSEWRWGQTGSTTIWYPGMRIFRQSSQGDWAPTIAQVSFALGTRARRSDPAPGG
jgi:ADP-heptose:LPS heptosyltransferase